MSQFVSVTAWHEKYCDRRTEPRIEARGTAVMTIVNDAAFTKLTATIVDVSRSGLQVALDSPLESGSPVGLRLRTALILGVVENCRPNEQGGYCVGILTTSVMEL